ncbi:MFS transporter [Actinotignum urinale]|uniref:MFS transporter n=1 Tax=Actinotignum urinale TaxID=190146 RepID=A0AAW9HNR9_9ACTO|nr:MFS transporter [Actinotignum urinale]MDY5155541.1 MFS transporter [Actinotignum urinale]MDY5160668.1 MFS transporter [Actinotignum urinale]WIK59333.1 MFS transporter [Actinotignum urinale]
MQKALEKTGYKGSEKLLWGIVLAVMTFWLFAGALGVVAPAVISDINPKDGTVYLDAASMNLAISLAGLFSGLFIVLFGGLADRFGRVKVTLAGIVLNCAGSLLIVFAAGKLALPLMMGGRVLQGLAAACIMPASMALVKAYWDGPQRQRAVSMWSIGSWGGSGFSALFGGAVVQYLGWRGIYSLSAALSVLAFLMIIGTPENAPNKGKKTKFDFVGLLVFLIGTLAMMIVFLYGSKLGWGSPITLALTATAVVAYVLFVLYERKQATPFIDFALFKNTTFTGATISNFLLNGTIGMLLVSQQVIVMAGHKASGELYTAWDAGLLTIGYGVFIIAFIRVGEKLLQRFGPRKPMIWGSLIVSVACILLMMTHLLIGQYRILAVVAYCLFGLGLAFYATPSTDAALSSLPGNQAGAGAGIYKMASSLGGAIGMAVSLSVYYSLMGMKVPELIAQQGRQDNVNIRLAAMIALGVNLIFLILAILSVVMTVPKGGGSKDLGRVAESPAPKPQLAPDDKRAVIIERLSHMSLADLEELERQMLMNKVGQVNPEVLRQIVEKYNS